MSPCFARSLPGRNLCESLTSTSADCKHPQTLHGLLQFNLPLRLSPSEMTGTHLPYDSERDYWYSPRYSGCVVFSKCSFCSITTLCFFRGSAPPVRHALPTPLFSHSLLGIRFLPPLPHGSFTPSFALCFLTEITAFICHVKLSCNNITLYSRLILSPSVDLVTLPLRPPFPLPGTRHRIVRRPVPIHMWNVFQLLTVKQITEE